MSLHLWPSPWNNAYIYLEEAGRAGNNGLDSALFPGAPYTISELDRAYEDGPIRVYENEIDTDSANFWAQRFLDNHNIPNWSPSQQIHESFDAVEGAAGAVADAAKPAIAISAIVVIALVALYIVLITR